MGVLVQIRNVDENVRAQLKARAAARGLSFNAYLRELLAREVETPSREQVLARISARAERSDVSSAELIRAARDERSGTTAAS